MTAYPSAPPETGAGRCRLPRVAVASRRMLLLHGLGGDASTWDAFLRRGGLGHEVWDADLPWRGPAEPGWTLRCDPQRVVTDLVNGEAPGCAREPFDIVVAHSYAAGLVLAALAAGEIRPDALVLVSPFYRADAASFDWPTISYSLNDFHLVFVEALRVSGASRSARTHRAANHRTASHRDWMGRQLRDRVGPYGWMAFFDLYLRTPFLRLDEVRVPVLVVRGDADAASRPEDSCQLTRALANARFASLPGCGHFPMIEQPEEFSRVIGRFLESTWS
ncbi:alpha/beta hydrolase [Micromonospora sp. CPCC 205371]|nr:alpha/beta hydrolase [Micromonospora sp. CPCC 205371]